MKALLSHSNPARRDEEGSSLIVVFWLLAILSLAVITSIQLVSSDVDLIVSQKKSFRADQLCEMGLAIAVNPQTKRYDQILTRFDPVANEGYQVRIRGEGGRLNINTILQNQDRELLARIFYWWGIEQEVGEELTDALIDWVDQDDEEGLLGAEIDWYTENGFPINYPFNRPFYDIDEMALVRGMEVVDQAKPNWRDYFTLYSSGQLDLREASQEMLEMVAEASETAALNFIEKRWGPDLIDGSEDDLQFGSLEEALSMLDVSPDDAKIAPRLTIGDSTVRIESTGKIGDYQKQVVLILQSRDSNPVILSREERYF
ncbi:MAG: hypothetical protein AAF514_17175 [Verrucomicrobiota bacterium]